MQDRLEVEARRVVGRVTPGVMTVRGGPALHVDEHDRATGVGPGIGVLTVEKSNPLLEEGRQGFARRPVFSELQGANVEVVPERERLT